MQGIVKHNSVETTW